MNCRKRLNWMGMVLVALAAAGDRAQSDESTPNSAEQDYSTELPTIPPLTPRDSLATFRVHDDFRLELVAAEPLVASPVALDFDEDGRMYVVEYPEFNQSKDDPAPVEGRIRLLDDTDGDGVYDKSIVYLDHLHTPTAVLCYDGGVFVGAAPDILYAKDTDGDDRADVSRVVLTGFARDLLGEAMLNSFRWTLDNRIRIQTSYSGGEIRRADQPDVAPVSVRGAFVLLDPRTGEFETMSGGGQHGLTIDDWGQTFVCTNSEPIHQILYDSRYLARNPFLEAPPAMARIAPGGYGAKVARISPPEPWRVLRTRLRATGIEPPHPTEGAEPAGYFTAASGVTIYRGDAWPDEYRGQIFVGEVANNLIRRARLVSDGVAMKAEWIDSGTEFLASSDTWSRPVQMANAPDGTLYVIDMYRGLIQSVASIPPAIAKRLDAKGGFDMGRIYRLAPVNHARATAQKLRRATTAELIANLAHPNGWRRDTASRLLFERQDKSAVPLLKRVIGDSRSPLARMHALHSLDGLAGLDLETLEMGLRDQDTRVRRHAIRLAEPYADRPEILAEYARLANDPDVLTRFQLAFSLGEATGPDVDRALVRLALRDGADPMLRFAFLSSVPGRESKLLRAILMDRASRNSDAGRQVSGALARLIGAANEESELSAFSESVASLVADDRLLARYLVEEWLIARPVASRQLLAGVAGEVQSEIMDEARGIAEDDSRGIDERVQAIHALGGTPFGEFSELAARLLHFRQPHEVQSAVSRTLAHYDEAAVPAILIENWPGFRPATRATATEALFSRASWIGAYVDAVEAGQIDRNEIDAARAKSLRSVDDLSLRSRAEALLAKLTSTDRQEVFAAYRPALAREGNKKLGKEIFKMECSACHRLEGVGAQIGADLTAIRDQGPETVLLNILDPNREVKPRFLSYTLTTDDGRIVSGMIAEETANHLTIRKADGANETTRRIHVEDLRSTGLSFMPEGMEKRIDVSAMADLLAYLKSIP